MNFLRIVHQIIWGKFVSIRRGGGITFEGSLILQFFDMWGRGCQGSLMCVSTFYRALLGGHLMYITANVKQE